MTINLKISDTSNPAIQRMIADLAGKGLITAAAGAVRIDLRDFFSGLEQTRPNKNNWPRQHFWADIRNSVQNPVVPDPTFATVSITDKRFSQQLEGGHIRPTGGNKYLTIPANEKAYGHRAREFSNLHFGFAENKYGNLAPALLENWHQEVSYGRKRKDGSRKVTPGAERGGDVFYFLARQVYQAPDPTVLPRAERLQAAATKGADEYLAAMTARQQAQGGNN